MLPGRGRTGRKKRVIEEGEYVAKEGERARKSGGKARGGCLEGL